MLYIVLHYLNKTNSFYMIWKEFYSTWICLGLTWKKSYVKVKQQAFLGMDSYLNFLFFCMFPFFHDVSPNKTRQSPRKFTCFILLHGKLFCCYYLVMDNKGRQRKIRTDGKGNLYQNRPRRFSTYLNNRIHNKNHKFETLIIYTSYIMCICKLLFWWRLKLTKKLWRRMMESKRIK